MRWPLFWCLACLLSPTICASDSDDQTESPDVVVVTVGTEDTHGLQRFERSARIYGVHVEVLGRGTAWRGGDMKRPGGGHKVNLLRDWINQAYDSLDSDTLVIFTDSYDVILLGGADELKERFLAARHRIIFAAEPFCWPDAGLAARYPPPDTSTPSPYLNSGGFIGRLEDMRRLIRAAELDDNADDQLHYTRLYLDPKIRADLDIVLDHNATIFQTLNGALSDVKLHSSEEGFAWLENVVSGTRPLILHGNGPAKLELNALSNYLPRVRTPDRCHICEELKKPLKDEPRVLLAVFIEQPTPFLDEFLQSILDIDYPKGKLELLVRNNVEYHETTVDAWFSRVSGQYASGKRLRPADQLPEHTARMIVLERATAGASSYVFSVDSVARVTPNTLRSLLECGVDVVAPFLARPGEAWSNFWGALSPDGYYARAHDYMDIVNGKLRGLWNVPFINNCYLLKVELFRQPRLKEVTFKVEGRDPDMVFCESLRERGVFMYVNNEEAYGHLINPEWFDTRHTNPDIYEIIHNRQEWEDRYISPEYWQSLEKTYEPSMPCPDVYWFPVVTPRFCKEWIEIMEAYGKWSDGSNKDTRLEGGYEAVPTRDIHMKQVGLETQWLRFLKDYIRPLQEKTFLGYYHDPPVSLMNFVVRYRPDEQPSLRPHHDSSTYTINLALNTVGEDYTGGGCRFIRYNCSVQDTRRGWILMHPGRLTHYHEGLKVISGTRYIMISFIDP
ncbi:procollagen-lysine,2-oxoglutarate 5-dioxygenase [Pieris rapae]|uniref:procollagen-lysine,2-oxoglutarate 5-dioxygenase n=1 Tax=Pieris rapae TaxID=64459 RepID=UPI000B92CD76|nr:procollagen-lysine,2-oxoglutarate 5-dioxygenase [Pieris rapae]